METLADRFKLDPFDILMRPYDEVLSVWVGAVISKDRSDKGKKNKKEKDSESIERVYSWNATWH